MRKSKGTGDELFARSVRNETGVAYRSSYGNGGHVDERESDVMFRCSESRRSSGYVESMSLWIDR